MMDNVNIDLDRLDVG